MNDQSSVRIDVAHHKLSADNGDSVRDESSRDILSYASASEPLATRLLIRVIETLGGRNQLVKQYRSHPETLQADPWGESLRLLNVQIDCASNDCKQIPASGRLLVVANHPFGILDGLALTHLLEQHRDDVLLIANSVLHRIPELRNRMLPIDFSQSRSAARNNVRTRRAAREHLKSGHTLAMFPGAGVATSPGGFGPAVDLPWRSLLTHLLDSIPSPVLPVYFPGQNGRLFQLASQLSLNLRISLLVYELNKRKGKRLSMRIGKPVLPEMLPDDAGDCLRALRAYVYALAGGEPVTKSSFLRSWLKS